MAFSLVVLAAVALLGATSSAHELPSTAGVRLRERVFFYRHAQFQGVTPVSTTLGINNKQATNNPSDPSDTVSRSGRRRTSRPGLASVSGRANVLPGITRNLDVVASGTRSTGFNGINSAQSKKSGLGNFTNTQRGGPPAAVSLCAGNGFLVQILNSAIAVYSYSGTLLAGILPLNQFLGVLPQRFVDANGDTQLGDRITGASCIYDTETKRFFFSASWAAGRSTESALASFAQTRTDPLRYGAGILAAVSSSSNPTQPWAVYFIPGTNDGLASNNDLSAPPNYPSPTKLQDLPQLQVDSNGLYITTIQFGYESPIDANDPVEKLLGSNIYAMSKRLLIGNVFAFEATRFAISNATDPYSFGIRPARPAGDTRYEGAAGGLTYFVSEQDLISPRSSVALWALSNTASLNSLTQDLRLQKVIVPTPPWITSPETVPQRDGPIPFGISLNETNVPADLDNYEPDVTSAAYQDGKVLFTLSTLVGADVGVAYGVLKPSINWRTRTVEAKLEQFQQFSVPGQNLIYPAISRNRNSKTIIAFTLLGPSYFPSAAYTTVDYNNQLSSVFVAATGAAPLDQIDGYPDPGEVGLSLWAIWHTVVVDEKGRPWCAVDYVSQTRTDGFNGATYIFKVNV